MRAQELLNQHDARGALKLIDELGTSESNGLPDHLTGLVISLQITALSAELPPAQIDAAMDRQRERMLGHLAFSALARLEATMVRVFLKNGDRARAAAVVSSRGFVGELASDPRAATSLRFWQAQLGEPRVGWSVSGTPSQWARRAVRYYHTAEVLFLNEAASAPLLARPSAEVQRTWREYLDALKSRRHAAEADAALAQAMLTLEQRGELTPEISARLRGDRANWALTAQQYDEAAGLFREVERDMRAAGNVAEALNAMAGEARAFSRAGKYEEAVAIFERAIVEAGSLPIQSNLLTGLAAAHVIKATESDKAVDPELIDKAIAAYRDALEGTSIDDQQRALARLGLARALGEKGEQDNALHQLDLAIAELAHLGSDVAKTLLTNRNIFVEKSWRALGLY